MKRGPNDLVDMDVALVIATIGKRMLTMQGWDGAFSGIPVPSPGTVDGDNGGSQSSDLSNERYPFSGFNNPNE